MTYAYALSGGWAAQHSAKGVVPLKLRPPAHEPIAAGVAATPTIEADPNVALTTLLAILGAVAVNVLLLAVVVGTVLVVIGVLKRSRAEHHAEMAHSVAAGATVGAKVRGLPSSGSYHDLGNGVASGPKPALPARPNATAVELTTAADFRASDVTRILPNPTTGSSTVERTAVDFRASDLTRILTDDCLDSAQRPVSQSFSILSPHTRELSTDTRADVAHETLLVTEVHAL